MTFVSAVGGGQPEQFLRPASRDVILGKEPGEIRSGNLLPGVARDLLGAGIPAADFVRRAHHENRMILDALDEAAILLLAVAQRQFRPSMPGVVAPHTPAGGAGNQQPKQRSADQDDPGLRKVLPRIRDTQGQQAIFFRQHLLSDRFELAGDLFAAPVLHGLDRCFRSIGPAQGNDPAGALDPLLRQRFEGRQPALLSRIVRRHIGNDDSLGIDRRFRGIVALEISRLAAYDVSAQAG